MTDPDNITPSDAQDLALKAQEAQQRAYEEELARLEQEISAAGSQLLEQWLASEESLRRQQMEAAAGEREKQERSLRNREKEFLRQIDEEDSRKKEEGLRRLDEERRRKEEEERRRLAEEERKRKLEEERILREIEEGHGKKPLTRKEADQRERSSLHLTNAEVHLSNKDFDAALLEVAKAFVYTPDLPEAIEMRTKIQQAQKAALAEAKAGEAIDAGKQQEEAKKKPKISIPPRYYAYAAGAIVLVIVILVLVQHRKSIFSKNIPIAIMPWNAPAGDDTARAMAFGIPELVTSRLAGLALVNPMGYSTAASVPGASVETLGTLGFSTVLRGSLSPHGGGYQVDLKLTDTSGQELWTKSFQASLGVAFDLRDQITEGILQALDLTSDNSAKDAQTKKESVKSSALYDYFLGLQTFQLAGPDNLRAAIDFFQKATAEDSRFASAAAEYASALVSLAEQKHGGERIIDLAETSAKQAVDLDSEDQKSHIALGEVQAFKRNYRSALDEFQNASHLAPNESEAYLGIGRAFLETGDYDHALENLQHAQRIDPYNRNVLRWLGFVCQLKGVGKDGAEYMETAMDVYGDSVGYLSGPIADLMLVDADVNLAYGDRVTAILKQLIDSQPSESEWIYRLARLEQVSGKAQEALPLFSNAESLLRDQLKHRGDDALTMVSLARTLTRLGRYAEANKYAAQAIQLAPNDPTILYRSAQLYTIQMFAGKTGGQPDSTIRTEALRNLQKAVGLDYRIEEICSGDFFNFHGDSDFDKAVQLPLK
jgi:tetratricopeptide (TPR) repeat protein